MSRYCIAPHCVGAEYNLFGTDVDADDATKFQGSLDWQYYGA